MVLFCFVSLLCTLTRVLKSNAEPEYSSLHLSQVIIYITFLLLQKDLPLQNMFYLLL